MKFRESGKLMDTRPLTPGAGASSIMTVTAAQVKEVLTYSVFILGGCIFPDA